MKGVKLNHDANDSNPGLCNFLTPLTKKDINGSLVYCAISFELYGVSLYNIVQLI